MLDSFKVKCKVIHQVSTYTGRNQLPIFCCTIVHPGRILMHAIRIDIMSQSELTTIPLGRDIMLMYYSKHKALSKQDNEAITSVYFLP